MPAGIHAARAAGIADPSEGTIVERSTAEVWDTQSSAVSRTYVLTITAGVDGLAPDLAGIGLEASCPERFDDLALTIEGSLKHHDVLDHDAPALGFKPRALDDA